MNTTPAILSEELDVTVSDYVDRSLDILSERVGKGKEEIALFFLRNGVLHTQQEGE